MAPGREKVIIDTDPAIGIPLRDVDDALAVFHLLGNRGRVEVLGITAVHGNAGVKKTYARALELLRVADREDIPVFRGAKSSRELGKKTPASLFLADAVEAFPGELTVLAIGPLTNVASAGLIREGFYERLGRLVIMGGTFESGLGVPPLSPLEFNFFKDPGACELVLEAPCGKVIITADLCRQVLFTARELNMVFSTENRVACYLARRIEPWLKLNQVLPLLPWKGGFVPWDLVAASFITAPEAFAGVAEAPLRLKRRRPRSGALEIASGSGRPTATVPSEVDAAAVLEGFMESLTAFSPRAPVGKSGTRPAVT